MAYYGPLVYVMAIWEFSGNLVYFPPFWNILEKSGNPLKKNNLHASKKFCRNKQNKIANKKPKSGEQTE
jgi:hypothetical protein